jgi:hypothetical protein
MLVLLPCHLLRDVVGFLKDSTFEIIMLAMLDEDSLSSVRARPLALPNHLRLPRHLTDVRFA